MELCNLISSLLGSRIEPTVFECLACIYLDMHVYIISSSIKQKINVVNKDFMKNKGIRKGKHHKTSCIFIVNVACFGAECCDEIHHKILYF